MVRLDETNLQILAVLQRDARASVVEIAQAVGRSESTVRERLAAMELDGVLRGYEVRVDWDRIGLPSLAVVRASCDLRRVPDVVARLQRVPNVTMAMMMTGRKPVLAILRVRDLQHIRDLVRQHLESDELTDIEVEVALQQLVERRSPSIQATLGGTPGDGPTTTNTAANGGQNGNAAAGNPAKAGDSSAGGNR